MPIQSSNQNPSSTGFTSRNGSLLTDNDIDLTAGHAYQIDNVPVLSAGELGATILKSKLRQVGTLNSLTVSGDANLADFAFFNSSYNRFGLGTDEPNASLSIVDNNVEIAIGSPDTDLATIGTYTPHDVGIITDNIIRLTVKNSGEIHIGNSISKQGVLRVFGTIYADSLVSDTRIDRMSSLEFKASKDHQLQGLGLHWSDPDSGTSKWLILRDSPDRLWTTESFDIGPDQSYYIDGISVINSVSLGRNIINSNLTTVGTLQSLAVQNETNLYGNLNVLNSTITAKELTFNDGVNSLIVNNTTLASNQKITISVQESEVLYSDTNEIIIGDKDNTRKNVKVFGTLSIGVNNPDGRYALQTSGNVKFGGKAFLNDTKPPVSGDHGKGDLCWNSQPNSGGYVGWVCIQAGAPGTWIPFGLIA